MRSEVLACERWLCKRAISLTGTTCGWNTTRLGSDGYEQIKKRSLSCSPASAYRVFRAMTEEDVGHSGDMGDCSANSEIMRKKLARAIISHNKDQA